MDQKLDELIEISRFYGTNKEYVIAGGGNTSFKNGEKLWIKASGITLADIQKDGFVCLSRKKLQLISNKKYSLNSDERENEVKIDLFNAVLGDDGKRPSVETSLHDLVNYQFVVHTHPTLVNSIMCSKKAKEKSFELFGDDILFIEYTDPGYVLFKKVAGELNNFRVKKGFDPKIILLENHGILVSADSFDEIKEIYTNLEIKILENTKDEIPSFDCRKIDHTISHLILSYYPDKENIKFQLITCKLVEEFVKDENSFNDIRIAFSPDHIVYCKSRYLFIEPGKEEKIQEMINGFYKLNGYFPKIIGIKQTGLLIIGEDDKSVNIITELIFNMMKISFYARNFGGSKPMTPNQIAFIENWEVENYRRKMAKS